MDRYELENYDLLRNQINRALSLHDSVCSDFNATLELDELLLQFSVDLAAKLDAFVDDYNKGAFVEV